MTNDFESAIRQLLKEVIEEVAVELLKDQRSLGRPLHLKQPVQSDDVFLLPSREAAKRLAISEAHLNRLNRTGILPCVRVGKCVRYSVETIQQWIRKSESGEAPFRKVVTPNMKRVTTTNVVAKERPATKMPSIEPKKSKATPAREKPKMHVSPPNRRIIAKETESEERRNPFADLLAEIGIDRSSLPSFTNGELMKIADVDHIKYHGWMHLNRQLPEEAREKLKAHFRDYVKESDDSKSAG